LPLALLKQGLAEPGREQFDEGLIFFAQRLVA
jgi:hypothetical protein